MNFARKSFTKHPIEISIHPTFGIYLGIMILILPSKWLCAVLIAAFIHEFGHYISIYLMGIRVFRFSVHPGGARIYTENMTPAQEFISAIAGPLAGSILMCCYSFYPQIAFCGMLHSVFNLIPIFPFDGGRILKSLCLLVFGERYAKYICKVVSGIVYLVLVFLSGYLYYHKAFIIGTVFIIIVFTCFKKHSD